MVDSLCSTSSEEESIHTPSFTPQKDDKYLQTLDLKVSLGAWRTLGIHYVKHSFRRWKISAQKIPGTWPRTLISSMSQADLKGKMFNFSMCIILFLIKAVLQRKSLQTIHEAVGPGKVQWEVVDTGSGCLDKFPLTNLSTSWFIYIVQAHPPQPSKLKGMCLVNHKVLCVTSVFSATKLTYLLILHVITTYNSFRDILQSVATSTST